MTRSFVGAKRVMAVLRTTPEIPEPVAAGRRTAVPRAARGRDVRAHRRRRAGCSGWSSADPDESAEVALRLGRMVDDPRRRPRWRAARGPAPGDGTATRRSSPRPSRGCSPATLRDELDPWSDAADDAALATAVDVAAAGDVARRAARRPRLPGRRGADVGSPAASVSGSRWPARCCRDATSSCWSSRPARSTRTPRSGSRSASGGPARSRARRRRGRTTVVTTASPLLLDHCDEVAFLVAGRVVATRHPPGAARPPPRLPRDRDPRGGGMSKAKLVHKRTATSLPVASAIQVREQARVLLADHRRAVSWMLALQRAGRGRRPGRPAAARQDGQHGAGQAATEARIDQLALLLAAALIAQTVLTWLRPALVVRARRDRVRPSCATSSSSACSRLPLSTVERAGTGDLVTRSTGDIEALSRTVRFAVPEVLVAARHRVAHGAGRVPDGPAGGAAAAGRRTADLARHEVVPAPRARGLPAPSARRYAAFNGSLAETVDGARTVEALGLAPAADPAARAGPRRRVQRRALHPAAAHVLVPDDGAGLRHPGVASA